MSVANTLSSLYVYVPSGSQSSSTQNAQSLQGSALTGASDPDHDGDAGSVRHGGHGGGHIRNALMQALESLGLGSTSSSATTSTTGTTTTSGTTGTTASDSDSDGNSTGSIQSDLHQFMHALFQAISSESSGSGSSSTATAASGTTTSASGGPGTFASNLSALITQVSNGSAPAALQTAFNNLVTDIQGSSGSSSASSGSTGSGSSATPTLQDLLTQLQQNLGYGTGSLSGTGNVVSAQA